MELQRRSFLLGVGSLFAAPAIVRAETLMKLPYKPKRVLFWDWDTKSWWTRINGLVRPAENRDWPNPILEAGKWVEDVIWPGDDHLMIQPVTLTYAGGWPWPLKDPEYRSRPKIILRERRLGEKMWGDAPFIRPSHLSMTRSGGLIESTSVPEGKEVRMYEGRITHPITEEVDYVP